MSASEFVMLTSMVVPNGMRISGPGTCGASPTSPNASTTLDGPSSASGYRAACWTTRRIDSTPFFRLPDDSRLSFVAARTGGVATRRTGCV